MRQLVRSFWNWLGNNSGQLVAVGSIATAFMFLFGGWTLYLQKRGLENLEKQLVLFQEQFEEERFVDLIFVVDNVGNHQSLLYANTGSIPVFIHGVGLEVPVNKEQKPNLRTLVYKGLTPAESVKDLITSDLHKLLSQALGLSLSDNGRLTGRYEGEFAIHIRYFSKGRLRVRRAVYKFDWSPPDQGHAQQVEPAQDQIIPSVH